MHPQRDKVVEPADCPRAVLVLGLEQRGEVAIVRHSDRGAGDDAHGELLGVAWLANTFSNTLGVDGLEAGLDPVIVGVVGDEAGEEVEEGFGAVVVSAPVEVSAVEEDLVDPVECRPELVAALLGVEEG